MTSLERSQTLDAWRRRGQNGRGGGESSHDGRQNGDRSYRAVMDAKMASGAKTNQYTTNRCTFSIGFFTAALSQKQVLGVHPDRFSTFAAGSYCASWGRRFASKDLYPWRCFRIPIRLGAPVCCVGGRNAHDSGLTLDRRTLIVLRDPRVVATGQLTYLDRGVFGMGAKPRKSGDLSTSLPNSPLVPA